MTDVICVDPAGAIVGEGPIWDEDEGAVYWVDIKGPAINRYVPATGAIDRWPMPERIGCLARRRNAAGFIAGFKSGLAFVNLEAGTIDKIGDPEPDQPGNRINDGKCDAQGRFWAGTMDDGETEKAGHLYRVDPDLAWRRVAGPYYINNGPTFSPEFDRFYHTDSFGPCIYVCDFAPDGTLSNRTVFVRFPEEWGYPDGMTTDGEGYIWVAHWGASRVTRFAPDGTADRVVEMPASQVTSCVFGGPDLATLYVTSAAIDLDEAARAAEPDAGGLFSFDPGVKGLPTQRFAG